MTITIKIHKQIDVDLMIQYLKRRVKVSNFTKTYIDIGRYGYFERPDLGVGGMFSISPGGRIIIEGDSIKYEINVVPQIIISIFLLFIFLAMLSDYWIFSMAVAGFCLLIWLSIWVNHRMFIHLVIRNSQIQD